MAIYAKQINPEYQESPLFIFGFPDDMNVFGNRHYEEHCSDLVNSVWNTLYNGELLEAWEALNNGGKGWYGSWVDALTDLLPPVERPPYTREERKKIPEILEAFAWGKSEKDTLCEVLEIVTGKPWEWCTIRGSSQSEWNEIVYPAENWSPEALEDFEIEYFNTGSEWIIHDENSIPESAEDVSGYCCYCHGWNIDQIRAELLSIAGSAADDEIIMWKFSGVAHTPIYSMV